MTHKKKTYGQLNDTKSKINMQFNKKIKMKNETQRFIKGEVNEVQRYKLMKFKL
jgi:hypothetical protein